MSVFINRRRLLGTIERHRDIWQYEDSRLVVNRSMSFRHQEYPNVTAELFARSFFVIRWTLNDEIFRWGYSHYGGKMYRTLTSMVRQIVKGVPPRGRNAPRIEFMTGNIPMELAFNYASLEHILIATLTNGEGSPGAFGNRWMEFLSVPDLVIEQVNSQVNAAIGIEGEPQSVVAEELLTFDEHEAFRSVEESEAVLPVPTGPIRIIRA